MRVGVWFWLVIVALYGCVGEIRPEEYSISALPLAGSAAPDLISESSPPVFEQLAVPPPLLSETGLFGPDVELYQPNYELWSDDAAKRRWVRLPAGTQIDSSDMDVWNYPVGTRLWKEFARDGRALETRYMAKHGPGATDWVFLSYQWNAEGTDAIAVPDGMQDVGGTSHDIPSATTCLRCHNAKPNAALGFSALQLEGEREGVTLLKLTAAGRLSVPPSGPLIVPGDAVASRALGYLHANCGGCHNAANDSALHPTTRIVFWQSAAQLASVELTSTWSNMVAATHGDLSALRSGVDRMRVRPGLQMPPVATEIVDHVGVVTVESWVNELLGQFPQPPAL